MNALLRRCWSCSVSWENLCKQRRLILPNQLIRKDDNMYPNSISFKVILLVALLLITTITISSAAPGVIAISIDQKPVQFTEASGTPFLDSNSRTLVPFRVALEAFGAAVYWNVETRTAIAEKNGIRVEVPVGQPYLKVDGQRVENDTSAVIVDGRTYLPIRKVLESFGAEVTWNSQVQRVEVISAGSGGVEFDERGENESPAEKQENQEPANDLELQKMIEALEGKVVFENDITFFALYAFINFTGFDEENNRSGFHPVRQMIRDDLKQMGLELMDNNYYRNKNEGDYRYRQALQSMTAAPDFQIRGSLPGYLSSMSGLDRHLREFYEKADIEALFEKYAPYFDEELDKYRGPIYPALAQTNQFLRVDSRRIPEFYLYTNLQAPYWSGFGLGSTYEHKGRKGMIVTGPSDNPNLKNVVHEYLHGIITPINNELSSQINQLSHLMSKVPSGTQAKDSYGEWFAIFDESVIRALDSIYLEDGARAAKFAADDQGFILAPYIHQRFANEFDSFDGTLKEFISMLIKDLKEGDDFL